MQQVTTDVTKVTRRGEQRKGQIQYKTLENTAMKNCYQNPNQI